MESWTYADLNHQLLQGKGAIRVALLVCRIENITPVEKKSMVLNFNRFLQIVYDGTNNAIAYNKYRHKLMPDNLISDILICLQDSSNVLVQQKIMEMHRILHQCRHVDKSLSTALLIIAVPARLKAVLDSSRLFCHSSILLHVPTPSAAARCHAAWRQEVCGKTSSAMNSAPPRRDDILCRLCAILSSGSIDALLANETCGEGGCYNRLTQRIERWK